MPLTSAQLLTRARFIAKTPGWTQQSGQYLNVVLQELAQDYDLDVAKGTINFTFNPSLISTSVYPNITPGGGPYPLPADFLRMVDDKDAMWFLLGVPYPMIPCDLSEYDNLVQQAGLTSFPYVFATDMSQSPPNLVVYPPPSGAFPVMVRYRRQMPDIVTPETSSTVPWFPNQNYLITRVAGELMKEAGDSRYTEYLGDGSVERPGLAAGILRLYLTMKDDDTNRAKTVKLDRRSFGRSYNTLPNTKTVGW